MSPQAPTVTAPHQLPLVTLLATRDESLDRDSKLVNCIAEKDLEADDYWVWKRPGLEYHAAKSGAGRGIYNWKDNVYSVFGSTLYKDDTVLGTVDSTNGKYVFQIIRGNPGYLVLGNGVKTYWTDGTVLEEIGAQFIAAGDLVAGLTYIIVSVGDSDFTLVGAVNNVVGTYFIATGPTDGTGTVALGVESIVAGMTYEIHTVGTTDFTTIGAASNTVGLEFVATAVGTGTGTVKPRYFPSNVVKGFAYLDGTLYVMDHDAIIWGSKNYDDPREWAIFNFISARVEPDQGVCLAKQLSYVIALKEWTAEVFYDAGNPSPASPLGAVQGAKSSFGCVSADSVQEIDDILLWVTSNRTVSARVAMMVDLKVQIISTPAIDRLLDRADFSDMFSWNFKHGGHRLYGFTLRVENLTLVYDLDQNLWYQWTDTNGDYWPICGGTFTPDDLHLTQHESNGNLYLLEGDYEYPTDAGEVFSVEIRTANLNFGIDRRKTLNLMRFFGDRTEGSLLEVRVSDDDYQTWSQWRLVDMSRKRPILTKCGTFYRRVWHLRHRRPTAFRIKHVDLQMDIGSL